MGVPVQAVLGIVSFTIPCAQARSEPFMRKALVLLTISTTALAGVACERDSTSPSAMANVANLPADQVLYGLHHVMTKEGVRTSVLDSDSAYLREEGRVMDLIGVQLKFFTESGAESGTLTSREGEYDVGTGSFVARKQVVLETVGPSGPRRVETEELNYQVKTDQLWSDLPFTMKEGGQTRRGSSFRSDSRFETVTVKNLETSGGLSKEKGGLSF